METLQSVSFRAMGSPCQIRLYASSLERATEWVAPAISEIYRLEKKYSRYDSTSYLSKINASAGQGDFCLDEETISLVNYADQAYWQSDGLFDVTSGVLRTVWNFKSSVLPGASEVERVLPFIGWDKLSLVGNNLCLPAGMELDFGGFVKEYAADAAVSQCLAAGIPSALVELGGDVAIAGDAQPWKLGIRHPRESHRSLASIELSSGALASSGDYERFCLIDGERYSHILNPLTGWPVKAPGSVSVLADSCLVAGTVSTVAMLHGEAQCLEWLDEIGLPYLCVFTDGSIVDRL